MVLTGFAIAIMSPIALAFLLLLTPGRKGYLRTTRAVPQKGLSTDVARSLYADRLARAGFAVEAETDASSLRALYRGSPSGETHAHSDKAILVEIHFEPDGSGTSVRADARMKSFVFLDTGEGRLLDLTLARLLAEDASAISQPVVKSQSFLALSGLAMAILSIATLIGLYWKTYSKHINLAAVFAGAILACAAPVLMSREARMQIRKRPEELTGTGIISVTIVLGIAGVATGAEMIYLRFGETLINAFKQLLQL
jgi:hypothetical protein